MTSIHHLSHSVPTRAGLLPALCWLVALCACGAEGEQITFAFAPTDGTQFTQKLTHSRLQEFSQGGSQTHASESATLFTITRTEGGYDVRAEQLSTTMKRDGEQIDDPVTGILRDMPATYETDAKGNLIGIRGFENVTERIRTELPPELSELLVPVLTEEALVERGTEEWNERFGNFVGKTVSLGDLWMSARPFQFAQELATVQYVATWFPELARCGERDCVRIRVFYDTDLEALRQKLAATVGERAARRVYDIEIGDLGAPLEGFRHSVEVDRLVEYSTLLPREEIQKRITRRSLPLPEGGIGVLTVNETKQYVFEYPQAQASASDTAQP